MEHPKCEVIHALYDYRGHYIEPEHMLTAHEQEVASMSPEEKEIKLPTGETKSQYSSYIDVQRRLCVFSSLDLAGHIRAAAITDCGKRVISGDSSNNIKAWDMARPIDLDNQEDDEGVTPIK